MEVYKPRPDRPMWNKVLYKKQPYADNHVDSTFLASLRTNANVQQYEYWTMVKSTAPVIHQLSALICFFIIFFHFSQDTLSDYFVIGLDLTLLVIGFTLRNNLTAQGARRKHISALTVVRHSLLFFALLAAIAPVLRTLTQTYCDDTIWALSMLLSAVHVFLHDYSAEAARTHSHGSLSVNAIVFASVLMASRLPTTTQVFAFVLFGIEVFALLPILRDQLQLVDEKMYLGSTVSVFGLTFVALLCTSKLLAFAFVVGVCMISFIAPLYMLGMQDYKREIQGPWDIAKVTALN